MLSTDAALDLIRHHLSESQHARHSICVGFMRRLADELAMDTPQWEAVGLCHDLDFEVTRGNPSQHGLMTAQWLADQLPEPALLAIKAHDHRTGVASDTPIANGLKLADALAVVSEALADRTIPTLQAANAHAVLTEVFADRPYLPAMLLDHSGRLGITLPSLAEICGQAPSPC